MAGAIQSNYANPKRKRQYNANRDMASMDDRLSGLPDSVLCHILSFLPTIQTIATSVLGRRWRSVWKDVPSLSFLYEDYQKNVLSDNLTMPFPEIVTRVLLHHEARSLNTFCLSSDDYVNRNQFESWMSCAVVRKVQVLDIYFDRPNYYIPHLLPHCLFTCKTLLHMKLRASVSIPELGSISLPCLKKLELLSVSYQNDKSLPGLISGCLALEDLIIERLGHIDGMSSCNICSCTVKRLKLSFDSSGSDPDCLYKLMIDTPALQFLNLDDQLSLEVSAGILCSLVEADICLSMNTKSEITAVEYGHSVYKFLRKLHKVKFLKYSSNDKKFENYSFRVDDGRFNNLTKLELAADWYFLRKFLEFSDNLEFLVIRQVSSDLSCWREPWNVPKSLMYSLKNVEVHGFSGQEAELQMVRYILRNAKALKMMEIYCSDDHLDVDLKYDVLQKISLLRRGSEFCRIDFH